MSVRGSYTTTDYIPFEIATKVADQLLEDGPAWLGLYITVAINTGLRCGDLRLLTWEQIKQPSITINEGKTGKRRTLAINDKIKRAVNLTDTGRTGLLFISSHKKAYSIENINLHLKKCFCHLKGINVSSHSLRKSFGRKVYNLQPDKLNALVFLSDLFNHTDLKITRKYLGIRQEELNSIYHSLAEF